MPTKKRSFHPEANSKPASDPQQPRQRHALATESGTTANQSPRERRIEMLLDAFFSGRSERTIRAYRQDLADLRQFVCPLVQAFVGSESLSAAVGHLLFSGQGEANAIAAAYKAALIARGLSAATINRRLAALRSLVKLARTFGMVRFSLSVDNVKAQPYRDTRGPGRDAVIRMMDAVSKRTDPRARRDTAILRLLYDLALRRGEVVALDLADLDLQSGTLAVKGKGVLSYTFSMRKIAQNTTPSEFRSINRCENPSISNSL